MIDPPGSRLSKASLRAAVGMVALLCQDRNGLGTELVDPEEAAKGREV